MVNFQDLFHVGIRVPDIDTAMTELGDSMGVTWAEVRDSPTQSIWTPDGGTQEVHLKYVYSAEGPQHIELLEGPPGSFWDGSGREGAHHLGIWSDDVNGDTDRLVADGWTIVGAHDDPAAGKGYGVFTYVQPPSGLIIELVDRAVRSFFEQWWNDALTD